MNMSVSQARIVDPILSSVALGYKNEEYIGTRLFPVVSCPKRGVKVIKFGKEAFILRNARRAPGADTARVMYGYEADPVALHQDSLEAVVPQEWVEETAGIPVDVASIGVNSTMDSILLLHEKRVADIAQNSANYGADNKVTLTEGFWDDPNANLLKQMQVYRAAVRAKIGRNPNTLMLPNAVFEAVKNNKLLQERFKYTSSESVTTVMLANYFEVDEVLVGRALYSADGETLTDIWNKIILSYVPPEGLRNIGMPSHGYTYRLKGYPIVEQSYVDKRAKSNIFPVTDETSPELTGMDAGFLVSSPLGYVEPEEDEPQS